MPDNGSGTYTLPQAAFITGTTISSSAVNADFSDIAAALNNRITRNGESAPSANVPMGTFRHTGVGNATARDQYATAGQVADSALLWGGTATGSANVQAISLTPGIPAYVTGQRFAFLAVATNTSTVTLAVSGLAATALLASDGTTPLRAGAIRLGELVEVLYDGTQFRLAQPVTGWQRLSTQLATLVSAFDILLPTGFVSFKLTIDQVLLSSNGAALGLLVSSDSGATFENTASSYSFVQQYNVGTTPTVNYVGVASLIDLTGPLANANTQLAEFNIWAGSAGTQFRIGGCAHVVSSTPEFRSVLVSGARAATGVKNAIRLAPTAGTISANVTLMGKR